MYASIVGECAYGTPACGVSRQNLLDLVYGELSAAGATIWPAYVARRRFFRSPRRLKDLFCRDAAEILDDVVGPVFTWAAREPTIPYARFNEWLQVSGYTGIIVDDTHTDGKTYYYDHESDRD